ncbi:hypothetical protein TNCV_3676591 [Trichonephila clavipes]|nr:hypothetical protein TNCV_3676591 [Trichonephila clavipes]
MHCSRVQQMSVILRYCNTSSGSLEETFIGFLAATETTGEDLTNAILGELKKWFRYSVLLRTRIRQWCKYGRHK